jgi:hypothetical protein
MKQQVYWFKKTTRQPNRWREEPKQQDQNREEAFTTAFKNSLFNP